MVYKMYLKWQTDDCQSATLILKGETLLLLFNQSFLLSELWVFVTGLLVRIKTCFVLTALLRRSPLWSSLTHIWILKITQSFTRMDESTKIDVPSDCAPVFTGAQRRKKFVAAVSVRRMLCNSWNGAWNYAVK